MAEVRIASDEDRQSMKKSVGGLFSLAYVVGIVGYSVWFLIGDGFHQPVTQFIHFFRETTIRPQTFSWQWDIIVGFILLDLWVSIGSVLLLTVVLRKKPRMSSEKWKQMLDMKPLHLFYKLLVGVAAEEIIFRWFPLAVLYPLWNTNLALWIVIFLSSVIFGLLHVLNQEPGQRNIAFTLPQFLSGFVFSYIFLAYGFEGAFAIHLLFDVLLLVFMKVLWECNPESFAKNLA